MKEERLNYYKEWIEENEEIVVDSSIFKELVDEINRLNNIIREALNYIDDNTYYKNHKGNINIDDLYIILQKGDNK